MAAAMAGVLIRPARAEDAAAIRRLVRSEPRLNPVGLKWPGFVVAEAAGALVGAAQVRRHRRDAGEFGSLVVRADMRGRGIAGRLIDAALARAEGRVYVVTASGTAAPYLRRGFRPASLRRAPWQVALNLAVGQAGSLLALARGLRPRRLVLLARP